MRVTQASTALVLTIGLALSACGGKGGTGSASSAARDTSARASREQVPDSVRQQLDSGNAAYRAKDYETARRHYGAATRMAPNFTAAWFGVYMAATALGDTASADSAKSHLGGMGQAAGMHNVPHAGMMPPGGMPHGTTGATPRHDSV